MAPLLPGGCKFDDPSAVTELQTLGPQSIALEHFTHACIVKIQCVCYLP